ITQADGLNRSVSIFYEKYSALPGDMPAQNAAKFGFFVGSCKDSRVRDGNGHIDGDVAPALLAQARGETGQFWQDLSNPIAEHLLGRDPFPLNGAKELTCSKRENPFTASKGPDYVGNYLPAGKLGSGTFIYVYENSGFNWFGISRVSGTGGPGNDKLLST